MKTPIAFHIAGILLLIAMLLPRSSDAQLIARNATPAKHFTFIIDSNFTPKPSDNYEWNNISIRARRDFLIRFKNANNTSWYKVDNGFIAKFTSGERNIAVTYDYAGEWLQTIAGYDEKNLPKEIKSLVKSPYYDFDIVHISEIQLPGNNSHLFVVCVQDAAHIKVLRIYNGEMQVLHDYKRE